MEKMEAYVRTNAQTGDVVLEEVPVPVIDPNEVLVRVQAVGVGIHDRYFIPQEASFPFPIGTEGTGIISEVGEMVTGFQLGDRVIFTSSMQRKGGCWAAFVAIQAHSLIPLPDEMDFTVGAAIPIAGKTALESMRELDLQKEDTLFVAGASGAIGTLIIQLAAARGVRVIGSASAKNHAYMQELGAEKAVDYQDNDWQEQVKQWVPGGVDAALAIQPGTGEDSMNVVKDGGKVITVSGDRLQAKRNITVRQMLHQPETQQKVIQLVSDIASGKMRMVVERVYPFDEALEALKKTETRHARGKLVVSLADNR